MPPKGKKAAKAEKGRKGRAARDEDDEGDDGLPARHDSLGDNLLGLGSTSPNATGAAVSPSSRKGLSIFEEKTDTATETHVEKYIAPANHRDDTVSWAGQSTWGIGNDHLNEPSSFSPRNSSHHHQSPSSRHSKGSQQTPQKSSHNPRGPSGAAAQEARASEKVVSIGSGNFPVFDDFAIDVHGTATSRGGGGGGWDVASAIGSSSSSVAAHKLAFASRKEEVTTTTTVMGNTHEGGGARKTSKQSRKAAANKLSTVMERASEAVSIGNSAAEALASPGHETSDAPSFHSHFHSPRAVSLGSPGGGGDLTSPRSILSQTHPGPTMRTSSVSSASVASARPASMPAQARAMSHSTGTPTIPAGEPGFSPRSSKSRETRVSQIGDAARSVGGPPSVRITSPSSVARSDVPAPHGAWRTTVSTTGGGSLPWGGGTPGPGPNTAAMYQLPLEPRLSGDSLEELEEEEVIESKPSGATARTVRTSTARMRLSKRSSTSRASVAGTESAARPTSAPGPNPTNLDARRAFSEDEPQSNTLRRVLANAAAANRPQPTHDVRIQETGGLALRPAQRAMFGRHRHASDRFYWTLPPEHDQRVDGLLKWVEYMGWGLGNLGLTKFLQWRTRGALLANADFRPWKSPEEPGFDWITFEESQNTLDRTLQESIATYDPSTTVLVFVFLVSKSGSSLGIWRRKVPIPPSLQLKHNLEIESVKRELVRGTQPVIKIEAPPRQPRPAAPASPPPPLPKGKRRWWLFFAREKVRPPKPPPGARGRR